jgi:hypothetical protein
VKALLLLGATAGASFGWLLFADKPRAGTGLAYVLTLVLFALLRSSAGQLMALVCTFGVWAQAAGLACVVWYERLASREIGVCDEGTGLPVGLMFGVGLLVVAAEFLRGRP